MKEIRKKTKRRRKTGHPSGSGKKRQGGKLQVRVQTPLVTHVGKTKKSKGRIKVLSCHLKKKLEKK